MRKYRIKEVRRYRANGTYINFEIQKKALCFWIPFEQYNPCFDTLGEAQNYLKGSLSLSKDENFFHEVINNE